MSIKHIVINSDKAIITCADCGCTDEDMYVLPDGKIVCGDCLGDDGYVVCRECGEVVSVDDATYDRQDGDFVCDDCMDGRGVCDKCGAIVDDSDFVRVDRGWGRNDSVVCIDCLDNIDYAVCDTCGDYFDPNVCGHTDNNGHAECDYCYDRSGMCTCEDCGEILASCECWHDDDDAYRCTGCHDTWEEGHFGAMHNYGYKPHPEFRGTDGHCLYLGVELEIDDGSDVRSCANDLQELTDDLYCKRDGSLDDGIEIVTHPCTLDYHRNRFPWGRVIETSKRYGFTSHDAGTCGLHVHVSREALAKDGDTDKTAAGRVIVLVDRLWDYLDRFSRRDGNHRWAARTCTQEALDGAESEIEVLENVYNLTRGSRYLAVNTLNYNTVEFRFNRGSLKYDTILASIELCHNLVTYAREHSLNEITHATWEDIISIGTEDGSNAELLRYCEGRMTGEYELTELPELHAQAAKVAAGYLVAYKNAVGVVVKDIHDDATHAVVSFDKDSAQAILARPDVNPDIHVEGVARELGLTNILWVPVADLRPVRRATAPYALRPGDVVIESRNPGDDAGNIRVDLMNHLGVVVVKATWSRSTYHTCWPYTTLNSHDCDGVLAKMNGWNFDGRELIVVGHIDDVSKYLA